MKAEIIKWLKDWFDKNGKDCNAVIGISGGKDSSVVAALCVDALGKDRVIGVLMPDGDQSDISDSYKLVEFLDIPYIEVNIIGIKKAYYDAIECAVRKNHYVNCNNFTAQTKFNLPPRIRMSVAYAVSQSNNGRVANTCNLSEDWVGYSTRYGDSVGDFSPISCFTVSEVKAIGRQLGLSDEFIEKVPSDGLSGKTDEDNLGFTYEELDKYIRTGKIDNIEHKKRIDRLHDINKFKLELMPAYKYKEI